MLRRPDGSRVLYDMGGDCLQGHWGKRKDAVWACYKHAMAAGETFHQTRTHELFDGYIEVITYVEPDIGDQRHAVLIALDAGSDYYVVDYSDHAAAAAEYRAAVHGNRNDEFPYQSGDLPDITVDGGRRCRTTW